MFLLDRYTPATMANMTVSKAYKIYKQPNSKMGNNLSRYFSKDTQIANKQMKRCSTLLVIREMQIKTTMGYYFTPTRMAVVF